MHDKILEMIGEAVDEVVAEYTAYEKVSEADIDGFNDAIEKRFVEPGTDLITENVLQVNSVRELSEMITEIAIKRYKEKISIASEHGINFEDIERFVLLKSLDRKWISHIDDMDNLRQGIGLRAYGNQNPINIYQRESFDMFEDMVQAMRIEVANILMGVKINVDGSAPQQRVLKPTHSRLEHRAVGTVKNDKNASIGRNDPCPCGSGKKYKNCCGK